MDILKGVGSPGESPRKTTTKGTNLIEQKCCKFTDVFDNKGIFCTFLCIVIAYVYWRFVSLHRCVET